MNADDAACRDTIIRCLRALDERNYDTLAALFAVNGVWDRGGQELVGPEAVLAAMERRPADLETQHLAANMIVDARGVDAATVRYTVFAWAQTSTASYHLHGVFKALDRLTRTADGWRFAHRSVAPAFSSR